MNCGLSGNYFLVVAMGFLLQKPEYICIFSESGVLEDVCTQTNICEDDPRILSWEIDWNSNKSLHNWHQELDLMCYPRWKIGLPGTIFFIGFAATLLWVPRLGDIYGR